jgi:uncharacterized protein YcfL
MRRAALLCLVAALGLSGCGGRSTSGVADNSRVTNSPTPSSTAPSPSTSSAKLSVGSVGFGRDSYGSMMAVARVTNPTEDGIEVSVNFAAYDASGKVLDTEQGGNVIMRATSTQVIATDMSVPRRAKVTRIDAQVSVDQREKDPHPSAKMLIPKVDIVSKYGSYSATGQISSSYTSTVSNVYVAAICFAAGHIMGGGYTFLDANVVGGAQTPFSVDVTVSQRPVKCEAAATLSNLSEAK